MSYTKYFTGKTHASVYKTFRPVYSKHVFSYISSVLEKWAVTKSNLSVAVDVGCGSGQATPYLSKMFDHVLGMDVSLSQLDEAKNSGDCDKKTDFMAGNSNQIPVRSGSCSYVQVFQAAHWFDLPKFYAEVDRVLKPGGVMVLSVYGISNLRPEDNVDFCRKFGEDGFSRLNEDFISFYNFLIANNHFPPVLRAAVDNLYRDYTMPYKDEIRSYDVRMQQPSNVETIIGYLRSWSGWQQYVKATGDESMLEDLRKKWKSEFGEQPIIFSWPMGLHFSRKPKEL